MNVIGDNLKRIRLLKGLSLKEAGELLNMSAPAVSKYEKGELKPNSQKLIAFANAYNVKTLQLLETYNIPQIKFTSFRKKSRLKGQKLELLKDIILKEIAKYLEVIEMNETNKKRVKINQYKCNSLEEAEKAAIKFRNDITFSLIQPISDLTSILENLGIVIIQIPNYENNFADFDGLSEIVNNIPIIVLLDEIKDGARQRFTIAHELGHLILEINNRNVDEEKLCDRFASSLLMPKEAVINEFGSLRNNISFYELIAFKNEYKVSCAATIYRLKDLKIISEYTYKKLFITLNKMYGKKNEPSPIKNEKSYQFKKIVHKLEIDKIISLNKACELLGVSTYEYNNENNNYGY